MAESREASTSAALDGLRVAERLLGSTETHTVTRADLVTIRTALEYARIELRAVLAFVRGE